MESVGDISPFLGGGGGIAAVFTLAPLPTGFLRGITVGELLTLVTDGRAGRGASVPLAVMLDGIEAEAETEWLDGRAG